MSRTANSSLTIRMNDKFKKALEEIAEERRWNVTTCAIVALEEWYERQTGKKLVAPKPQRRRTN